MRARARLGSLRFNFDLQPHLDVAPHSTTATTLTPPHEAVHSSCTRDHSTHDSERDKPTDAIGLEDDKQSDTGDGDGDGLPTGATPTPRDNQPDTAHTAHSERIEQSDATDGPNIKPAGQSTDKLDDIPSTNDAAHSENSLALVPAGKATADTADTADKVCSDKTDDQPPTDSHATEQENDTANSGAATNPFHPWERKMDAERNWPFWYNVETGELDWVQAGPDGNPLPIPSSSDYSQAHGTAYSNQYGEGTYGGQYGNGYSAQHANAHTGGAYSNQYGGAYSGQYGSASTGHYGSAYAGYAASSTDAASSPAKPKRLYGGYNPAIHGSYDPNADYAKEAEREEEEAEAAMRAAQLAAAGVPPPGATISVEAHFNQVHGRFQDASMNPELHNDDSKSHRQMNAFFDVNTAANQHDGRSLKEERRGQKLNKAQLQFYKKRVADRRAEKLRKFWME
ncbi:hypothetical protein P154DRAFT_319451 [Amniculicola lignicola CBS 123094]|uniref:WW domain-containing protein n=1 Tax=Amniculicola lignicola CBS 123094 TaxID=1392246 RepID=A0A6A5W5P6_9PLEO|nr:hypothetical protein P154DRAFT_319451 [Amniculicola lignicola CBS 123094]